MKKTTIFQRMLSVFLCLALLISSLPMMASAATAALSELTVTGSVTDPGSAHTWEEMMGTDADGNRYAGRVWVDKSVYKDGDTVLLNSRGEAGSSFKVSLKDDEAFQIVFSALGSTMTTKSTVSSSGPMDVVLVLDTSTSMDDKDRFGVTRLERTIDAANSLLDDLLTINGVRIAIVTYNNDSETVLPLNAYANGINLVVTDYENNGSSDAGVVTAYDDNSKELGKDSGYTQGTNLQAGIDRGFNILANATDIDGRLPVAIVLTDGQANRASKEGFYEISSHKDQDGTGASNRNLYLSTLLNAAYTKTKIEEHYKKDATVYTIGVDVSTNVVARLLMNPADPTNGFNQKNSNSEVKRAYENFQKWARGENVSYSDWTFNHSYPNQNGAITDEKIAANIHYADTYYDVSNAELKSTFDQIYEELSSGVFNPISSSTSVSGGTGVDNTPLIYVDFIGQHMEIKEFQAITLFGNSYGVVKTANGYTVTEATGVNPTTGERWNTAQDILISVTEQQDGTQKLELRINQEILPIIMEQVLSETVGDKTVATITELLQEPLRAYYTVGVDSDVLLPGGEIDLSKIQGYHHIDDQNGTVSFYSNSFGVMNPAGQEGVTLGDAHVGFRPSFENRYYYHQNNQGIFTAITDKESGKSVTIPENNEYGIIWDESKYEPSWMTYEEYQNTDDSDKVYTYVSYYHPTPLATDAASAAEEVTYLVYTDWAYLKESVAFYDATAKSYLNDGAALEEGQVESTISEYLRRNPNAEIYAVLGVGSLRTSRLHNMHVEKAENATNTASFRYAPEYTHETAEIHNGNSVVVWLGNNGKLTVKIDTGIALTKQVTEAIGNANDTYTLTVTVPEGVNATPKVVDEQGNTAQSSYENNVLTVNVKAGQTVYVSGIPGGTECTIDEVIKGDYYIASKTDRVTVPLVSEALGGKAQFAPAVVTNAPYKYGNLFITKEITSDHAVPSSVLNTSFEIVVNLGTALAGQTFTVEDSAHEQPYSLTSDRQGNLYFDIQARQTVEIFKIPAGTVATVTELQPDDHFAVSYRTRNHSGEDADTDNSLVIPTEGSATAVVFNHYTPFPVSVVLDIQGTKNFTVDVDHDGGTFYYKVQKWNGSAWEDLIGKSGETVYGANESGQKSFSIKDVLAGITYTQVGNYSYQVLEVKGDVVNVTYDRTLYTFDVTVSDNGGQLVAVVTDVNNEIITDGSYEVSFHNTYLTAPVSMDILKTVNNLSGDSTVSAQGFKFKSVPVDQFGNPLEGNAPETAINTIFSDAAGEARISGYYTREQIGTHYYIVYEEDTGKAGWSYSKAEYFVTVVVAEQDGKLSATMTITPHNDAARAEQAPTVTDSNKGQLHFTNTYDPQDVSVDLDGAVSKVLSGMTLQENRFTFYVYENGKHTTPVLVGTNNLKGDVHFVDFDKALSFERTGRYEYDIVEYIPDEATYDAATGKYVLHGMSYDATIYDLVVEVTNDSTTGKLVASYYFEDAVSNSVTFYNSYQATATTYTLGGVKLLHGRAPRDGEFSFDLYEGSSWKQSTTNKADGSFTFKSITYTEAGVYTYVIKEAMGSVAGVSYDGVNTPITVTVTVTDQNGVLVASADVRNEEIKFENTYTARAAQVIFNGTKVLVGDDVADYAFTFKLYQTDSSFDVTKSSSELLASTQNAGSAFSFERALNATGTFYFVITEDAENPVENLVYDGTRHTFVVRVSDVGTGQLQAVVTNMITGVSSPALATVSTNLSFTNATFREVTEKEVYLAGAVDTEIDGKKVNAGDVLTYFITYTNYTGEDVVVDIMDTIPNHTSYVEGSASHNGSYAGTHLNWILTVVKGESVTVSFEVRVNETDAIVANTAVVRDGKNLYTTNEVVNHTVEEELKKDVFAPSDLSVSIDGKKVYEGEELLYKISFINVSGDEASITITDKIPEYTSYVEGSADNGGVYQNGILSWSIGELAPWERVTVAFKVRVNSNIGAKTISNQANATDGENSYESAWVVNYTVVDEVEKTVVNDRAPEISIDGKKVYAGDTLLYTITYKNTAAEEALVTITDKIPAYTTYVEGSADHEALYTDGVLTWTLNVEAGKTVTVSFKVTVEDAGTVSIQNKAEILEGKNSYTTNEVTNYTVKDEVSKDVFGAEDPTVSIDGEQVSFEDLLLYVIRYKNTSLETATITITDTIPEYTTYVAGSADNGGIHEDGKITWNIDVEAGQEISVSFMVKVAFVPSATITNLAEVAEGKNTYTTNEVSNPTENPVNPDLPSTGDNTALYLWFALALLSGGLTLTVLPRIKKKKGILSVKEG